MTEIEQRFVQHFGEMGSRWFDDVQRLDSRTLMQLMRLGARVQRLLEAKNRISLVGGRRASP